MAAAAADCPACGRYIGRATVCPYCDVDIPVPLRLRLLRIGAWVLASGGLLLTWVVATGMSGTAIRHAVIILPDLPFRFYTVIKPHLHWMLWCGIVLILLAEPLQPVSAGKASWRRFLAANRPTGMAALVFGLSGMLGVILFNAATFTPGLACLGLVPAGGIGALPLLHDVRRRNALGIILVPLACELSGLSPALAAVLRLH